MKKKKIFIVLIILAIIVALYMLTYIPHKLIDIDYRQVSRIEIFDGGQGKGLTVDGAEEIKHIISNLGSITFKKGKCSIGYMGYRFRLTIYKSNGGRYRELIVNSGSTVRYNGFFYKDEANSIDFSYLDGLFDMENK